MHNNYQASTPNPAPCTPQPDYSDFEDAYDITVNDLSDILVHGDTSMLIDHLYFQQPNNNSNTVILDVRTPAEVEECPHAAELATLSDHRYLNISVGELTHLNRTFLEKRYGIRQNQTLLCLCHSGKRSGQAFKHLNVLGYDCFNVYGGVKEYARRLGRTAAKRLVRA